MSVARGSTRMILPPCRAARLTQNERTGCDSTVFEPITRMQPACSSSRAGTVGPAEPKAAVRSAHLRLAQPLAALHVVVGELAAHAEVVVVRRAILVRHHVGQAAGL